LAHLSPHASCLALPSTTEHHFYARCRVSSGQLSGDRPSPTTSPTDPMPAGPYAWQAAAAAGDGIGGHSGKQDVGSHRQQAPGLLVRGSTHSPRRLQRSQSFLLLPPSSFLLPPSSFLLPPSSFLLPPSSFLLPPPSFLLPPSSFLLPPSSFLLPPSSFPLPPSSFLLPPSSFLLPPSSFLLRPRRRLLLQMLALPSLTDSVAQRG